MLGRDPGDEYAGTGEVSHGNRGAGAAVTAGIGNANSNPKRIELVKSRRRYPEVGVVAGRLLKSHFQGIAHGEGGSPPSSFRSGKPRQVPDVSADL
jgi:hypothetical protein